MPCSDPMIYLKKRDIANVFRMKNSFTTTAPHCSQSSPCLYPIPSSLPLPHTPLPLSLSSYLYPLPSSSPPVTFLPPSYPSSLPYPHQCLPGPDTVPKTHVISDALHDPRRQMPCRTDTQSGQCQRKSAGMARVRSCRVSVYAAVEYQEE